MWPGDGRFFTSRTRSRFPLMFCLPASGGSRFSRLLPPPRNPWFNPFTRHANFSSLLPSLALRPVFVALASSFPPRSPRTFPSSTFLHLQHTPRDVLTLYARLPEILTAIRLIRNRGIPLSSNYTSVTNRSKFAR